MRRPTTCMSAPRPAPRTSSTSGETQATSWSAATLPTTGTFYARIYAKLAGVWRYSDIAFSTSPLTASLITPANGSTGFDPQHHVVPVDQRLARAKVHTSTSARRRAPRT